MSKREIIGGMQHQWHRALLQQKFLMKIIYDRLDGDHIMDRLLIGNKARPQASLCLWLACHGKLDTMDRLLWFGMVYDSQCKLCMVEDESIKHIFFECRSKTIWRKGFNW